MKYTSIRISTEVRDILNEFCHTDLGKITPDMMFRNWLGLEQDEKR